MKWFVMALLLAAPCFAQTSQPTTRETRAAESYPALTRRLRELTAENQSMAKQVKELLAENFALKTTLADRAAAAAPVDANQVADQRKIAAAIAAKELAIGMTIEQANRALGPGKKVREDADGTQAWMWARQVMKATADNQIYPASVYAHGTFQGGRLISISEDPH